MGQLSASIYSEKFEAKVRYKRFDFAQFILHRGRTGAGCKRGGEEGENREQGNWDVQTSTAAGCISKHAFIEMMEKPSLVPLGFHSLGSAPSEHTKKSGKPGEP